MDDGLESIDDLVKRVSAQNRPLSASSRRKSIPPKRRIIPPYSSDHSNSPQPSRFSAPKPEISKIDKPKLEVPKPEVKTETEPKSSFKLHQPKAFGKNTMLEKKISELQSSILSSPESIDKSANGVTAAAQQNKNVENPAEDVNVSEYLVNLEKKTISKPDKSMKAVKKKSEKSNKSTAKLKLGSPRKLEKMKNLRRSPRKSNSITFTQTFGLSVLTNTKLPGRIPKKKKT